MVWPSGKEVKRCDGLYQGQLVNLVTIAFPGSLLRALRQVLGRRGAFVPTRNWRCSSVRVRARRSTGNGLCAVVPVSHEYLGATASDTGSLGESVQ